MIWHSANIYNRARQKTKLADLQLIQTVHVERCNMRQNCTQNAENGTQYRRSVCSVDLDGTTLIVTCDLSSSYCLRHAKSFSEFPSFNILGS